MGNKFYTAPKDLADLANDMRITCRMAYDAHEVLKTMLNSLDERERDERAASALRVASHELNTIIIRLDPEVGRLRDLARQPDA